MLCFDFQLFTEKPVFECPFAHPMILFLSSGLTQYLSRLRHMQISYDMISNAHVRQLTVSLQKNRNSFKTTSLPIIAW